MTQNDASPAQEAEQASLHLEQADTVRAKKVSVTWGGVGQAHAEEIVVNTGGIVAATAGSIEITKGAVLVARAEELGVNRGQIRYVQAGRAELQDTTVGLLLAREVHGDVRVLLDQKGALLAGLAAGLVLGLVHLLSGNRKR
jgi:hypothetical protein